MSMVIALYRLIAIIAYDRIRFLPFLFSLLPRYCHRLDFGRNTQYLIHVSFIKHHIRSYTLTITIIYLHVFIVYRRLKNANATGAAIEFDIGQTIGAAVVGDFQFIFYLYLSLVICR